MIVQMIAVQLHGALDRSHLAFQHLALGTGSRPHPVARRAAVERIVDRRRDRRVADPHLADAQQVRTTAGNRLHAEGHGRRAVALGKGGLFCDVARRIVERQVEDLQAEIVGDTDLVDRRAAGGKVLDHLLGDCWRKRRNSLFRHTVIAREDRDQRPIDSGHPARPGGQPEGDFLDAPERARRLRQLRVTLACGHQRPGIRPRQIAQQRTEIVERQA